MKQLSHRSVGASCAHGCAFSTRQRFFSAFKYLRRERAIALEQDRIPGSDWNWMHLKRDDIRQVLGFFIGETPVDPFAPTAAAATGPP